MIRCVQLVIILALQDTISSDLRGRARSALLLERSESIVNQECQVETDTTPCPPSKFRSPTGECNNVNYRDYGARGDIFVRMLSPDYADKRSAPRTSIDNHALPSPDYIIEHLQKSINKDAQHPHITSMLPAWGKLLAYDLFQVISPRSQYKCCDNNSRISEDLVQCFVQSGKECKEYMRSVPSREFRDCLFKYREQMNAASGFIDGSGLYGATEKEFLALRTFSNGKVDIKACARCNEAGAIGALHVILLKEHNRIAEKLSKLNKGWSDTVIFLEARRAVIAQIQHITFNEFLPIVLGQQVITKEELRLLSGRHYSGYSSVNRAGVFNEAAVSAFPAFYSMLPADMMSDTASAEILISTPALQQNFIPFHQTFDDEWTPLALAIQRGRDHGIPAYHKALNLCEARFGLSKDSNLTYEDVESIGVASDRRKVLENIYKNPADIDLIIGGLSEKPSLGTVFGPTLTCLLAIQFSNLRKSDRFWYENDLPPSSLNLDQLQAVRRVSLAGLLCAANGVTKSQPKAFIREDPYLNARLTCDHLSGLDLNPWKSVEIEVVEDSLEDSVTSETQVPELEELSSETVQEALKRAKDELIARKKMEYESWMTSGGIDARSPDGTAASFSKANRNALIIANSSHFYELATNELLMTLHSIRRRKRQVFDNNLNNQFNNADDFVNSLQNIDINSFMSGTISSITLEPQCEDLTAACDTTTPFRTFTGYCNNLKNPSLGQSLTVFARLLPSVYEDGVKRPRATASNGSPLPNPRVVSTLIHPDISNLHTRYSLMTMQFAQFLDHDLTMTPIHKGFHESIPSCRSCDSPRTVHQECLPFPIPPRDHFYPEVNVTSGERLCFPFMRSLPGQQTIGPREQINQNTAFLDASQVYGENNCICQKLRGFSGRMNSTIHPVKGKELLPQSPTHPECKAPSGQCFIAGDGRASEQPGLTAIHTTFLREHNRLVEGLRGVNPHWTGEQLFHHARRIISAQNQHITYNEFLPRILSWNAVNLYGLKLLPQGYYKDYNPGCNPAIVTEFASAAFRIGHSLLRPHIPRLGTNHQPIDPPILLRDGFFKPDMFLQAGMIDEVSRGLVATPMETLDQFITGEVTNHLFEDRKIPFSGVDLIALNIQRARDHGIPSYNNYRSLCNLKRATTWDDLSREIPPEVINRFKRIYPTVDDIDLFPGGMSERPLQGGLVGPTFACIIAIQFRQLRKCDRFWYENENPTVRFTEAQLTEIRKTTLAKIVCDNLDVPGDMQRAAFDLPSNFLNPRVPCHSMPHIDLSAWRENVVQGCTIGGKHVSVGESAFPSPCTSCICTNDGPQCASLRITDCAQLAREWPREVILRDDVCATQCGLVLQRQSSRDTVGLRPPPRVARSRPSASFQGFKFPDLTQFVVG
ncbi:CLUMA_CG007643, isoform A [Clunio marinus]|uniref:CLUMA_CG007643, isoform A n=1 Tax=Clunio marinus TaxID=568069 RepID=A0A1J1I1B5_9DIPT|nr:CLUMA_CG007643, isoform A [Clunio marinus]